MPKWTEGCKLARLLRTFPSSSGSQASPQLADRNQQSPLQSVCHYPVEVAEQGSPKLAQQSGSTENASRQWRQRMAAVGVSQCLPDRSAAALASKLKDQGNCWLLRGNFHAHDLPPRLLPSPAPTLPSQ